MKHLLMLFCSKKDYLIKVRKILKFKSSIKIITNLIFLISLNLYDFLKILMHINSNFLSDNDLIKNTHKLFLFIKLKIKNINKKQTI